MISGCNLPAASTPTPDLFATLQASTPSGFTPPAVTEQVATSEFDFATPTFTPLPQNSIPAPSSADLLTGKIVFTCQVNRVTTSDQICIINADGSGFRQLTSDNVRHYYPSLAPDGQSVLYSAFREQNVYEIYELNLNSGVTNRLTNRIGVANAPDPHESYYRPPVKYRCVDGFLGVGDALRPLSDLAALEWLVMELRVDGVMRQRTALADLMRDAATLWTDVSAFQSMRPGDVLMLGTDCLEDGSRPRVKAGDSVEITATGFAPLVNHFVGEDQ